MKCIIESIKNGISHTHTYITLQRHTIKSTCTIKHILRNKTRIINILMYSILIKIRTEKKKEKIYCRRFKTNI